MESYYSVLSPGYFYVRTYVLQELPRDRQLALPNGSSNAEGNYSVHAD